MEASKSKSLASILLVDLLCLSAVGIPLLLLKYLMQPNFLGFFCSDESLRYPYSPSTIPTVVNVSVSYGIPLLLIIFINVSTLWISSSGSSIRSVMKKIYNNATIFLFGVFSVQLISNVCKLTAGRLRPHFIDVCQPSNLESCNPVEYIMNYTCQGNPSLFPDPKSMEHRLREARLSFLSGHSSLAFYGMIYSVILLQQAIGRIRPVLRIPRGVLQVLCLLYAIFVSLTRITDYKHHPTDVIAGAILGTILAVGASIWGKVHPMSIYDLNLQRMDTLTPDIEFKVP